jgi:4-alpha-glucanotransferase
VLWFTREWTAPDQPFIPAEGYPRNALASISTHDLPTATGFLRGEQVRVRAELGLLTGTVAEEEEIAKADREALLALLASAGLITADSDEEEIVLGMHEFLARTPCRFITASLYDVLGEIKQPNLPGTSDEYPNWRMPLAASLEEIEADPRMERVARVLKRRG